MLKFFSADTDSLIRNHEFKLHEEGFCNYCGKRRNGWLPALIYFSSFPTMFCRLSNFILKSHFICDMLILLTWACLKCWCPGNISLLYLIKINCRLKFCDYLDIQILDIEFKVWNQKFKNIQAVRNRYLWVFPHFKFFSVWNCVDFLSCKSKFINSCWQLCKFLNFSNTSFSCLHEKWKTWF